MAITDAAKTQRERTAKTRLRIEADVAKARKGDKLPSRQALVTLALDVYKLALDKTVDWANKKGVPGSRASPDFKAATDALKVASSICGYDRPDAPAKAPLVDIVAVPTVEETEAAEAIEAAEAEDAEAALAKLRSRLVLEGPPTREDEE